VSFPLISPYQQFFDSSGSPLVSGTIEFRDPTTNNLINSYPTADDADAQTNANSNPLTLNAAGAAASGLYLEDGVKYKIILKDSSGATVTTQDDVRCPLYSANAIGQSLYAQTSAESAAGVTPTNYEYAPGNIDRYVTNTTPGTTDCTTGIQNAFTVGKQTGGPVVTGEGGQYLISSTVTISCDCDLWNCEFHASGVGTDEALEVSTGSAANPTDRLSNKSILLPRLINDDKPGTGWASQGIGIRCVNLVDCFVRVPHSQGFTVGLNVTAYDVGNAYNEYQVFDIENCKEGILIQPGNTSGWCNQNNFTGCLRCQIDSGEGTNVSGVRHIRIAPSATTSAGGDWPNHNVFLNPAVEGSVPEYDIEIAGANNLFIFPRLETTPKVHQVGHASNSETFDNVIVGGFGISAVTWSTSGTVGRTQIVGGRDQVIDGDGVSCNVGNTTGSTNPHFQGFPSSVRPLGKTASDTDWTYRLSAHQLEGKGTAETSGNRITIDFTNGEISLGSNAAADVSLQRRAANKWGLGAGDGFCVGNSVANTNTPSGATAKALEIFDETGASLGFIPIYASQW
jgi:hypothetical protein